MQNELIELRKMRRETERLGYLTKGVRAAITRTADKIAEGKNTLETLQALKKELGIR